MEKKPKRANYDDYCKALGASKRIPEEMRKIKEKTGTVTITRKNLEKAWDSIEGTIPSKISSHFNKLAKELGL